jgi:hypothetical protein
MKAALASPLLLLLLLASACGGAAAPAPGTAPGAGSPAGEGASTDGRGISREPSGTERAIIAELSRRTERTRELTFARPVPVLIQDQVRISAHLSAMIKEEDLDKASVTYAALGLIAPDLDLRAMVERLASEQVVGYYDPKASQLVVRDDVMRNRSGPLDEAAAVLVHELVHALQDQRLGLGETFDTERDTDADNAFDGLVEGDATLAMLGYVLEDQGVSLELLTQRPELLAEIMENAPPHGMELDSAPPIVRVTLVAPYFKGLTFAATLHRQGGWAAVNDAHGKPPISTEQLLHPDKYLAGEMPEVVVLPALEALDRAGYVAMDDDTLGELEMSVYLAQHRAAVDADEAAATGWAGDRIRVYRHPERGPAVVWVTLWDDVNEAKEAASAAQAVATAMPKEERKRHRVERSGRAVLILRNLAPELHEPVRKAFRELAPKR